MKIGIYGDSFADHHTDSKHIAWYNILSNYIPGSTVTCYGKKSTSVYYSYKKFLETYSEFDKVIFLITNPDRYTKELTFSTGEKRFFPSIVHLFPNALANIIKTNIDKKIIDDLRGWFISVDTEYNELMTEFIMRDIEKLHSNVVFFPCFNNSINDKRKAMHGLTDEMYMINIQNRQTQLLNTTDHKLQNGTRRESRTNMAAHLGEEFNLFVAKLFANKILNNEWNWEELYKVELKHDLDFYYEKLGIN